MKKLYQLNKNIHGISKKNINSLLQKNELLKEKRGEMCYGSCITSENRENAFQHDSHNQNNAF